MFALKGPKMKHGVKGYDTNFPLEHAQKDVRFAQMLGDDHGISMSVSSAANGKLSCILGACFIKGTHNTNHQYRDGYSRYRVVQSSQGFRTSSRGLCCCHREHSQLCR